MSSLFSKSATPILALPRMVKQSIAMIVDLSLCILCSWLAVFMRTGEFVPLSGTMLWAAIASAAIALPIFCVYGFYREIFRYSGWPAFVNVAKAAVVYGLVYSVIFMAISIKGIPRTVGLIQPMLLLISVGASRAVARFWLGGLYQSILKLETLPKALIYGAGNAGRQLAIAMAGSHEMRVTGFLDDDKRLHGHVLHGHPIYNPEDLQDLIAEHQVSDVLLALPAASRNQRSRILSRIRKTRVSVRTLPSVTELAQGKVSISDLRELDIYDLLSREPVAPNHILLGKNITGKTILVTGAGGSIGGELCRQIVNLEPMTLLLVERSEPALYNIHQELLVKLTGSQSIKLVPLLASIRDQNRLQEIFATWQPDTVYHAAAYKHVPLVEHNPAEGIKNNVFGTLITARVAAEHGVKNFVLISTDKAVRPTNIMGASKRLAEMVLQALSATSPDTCFSMVRFGNVLGSSGSVVPVFRRQIRDGGPITLTHPEITRFFMTIPEAALLVIQAGSMAKGGDVFVLDMGQPVKIIDLAKRMIELSGLTVKDDGFPDGDIEIAISGLRPGEKLYEELLIGDNPTPTSHPRIMKAQEEYLPWGNLKEKLDSLMLALDVNDIGVVRLMLSQLVSGYAPSNEVVDWIYMENELEAITCASE